MLLKKELEKKIDGLEFLLQQKEREYASLERRFFEEKTKADFLKEMYDALVTYEGCKPSKELAQTCTIAVKLVESKYCPQGEETECYYEPKKCYHCIKQWLTNREYIFDRWINGKEN